MHRRECSDLKDENSLAEALSQIDLTYQGATDGRALRKILVQSGRAPLLFVLTELRALLVK